MRGLKYSLGLIAFAAVSPSARPEFFFRNLDFINFEILNEMKLVLTLRYVRYIYIA